MVGNGQARIMMILLRSTLALVLWLAGNASAIASESIWFEDSRPTAQAQFAVGLLTAAASHGMDSADYEAGKIQQVFEQARQGPRPDPITIAQMEQKLTNAMQSYLHDLHRGHVDPRQFHFNFTPPRRNEFDPAQYLRDAVSKQRLREAVAELEPRVPLYSQLRDALISYRKLVEHPAWHQPLPALPMGTGRSVVALESDQSYPGLSQLAERLIALGDLAPNQSIPARYEGALVEAVKSFQRRHGLPAEGLLGAATFAQLQVEPLARVRQIELTLERLRWTPLLQAPRMIVINVPEFVLRAYEVSNGTISLKQEMKVIVGKSQDTRTPLFDADMRYIEFSPYWNVPPSIARAEIVPKLRRDPGYLEREGFEFISTSGTGISRKVSASLLDAVLAGTQRIRQRPGPRNALGDIKFVFPNSEHIFLHHTPAKQLFERSRRDFSHGCIRVENPVGLAKFVLEPMPQWTDARIRGAMTKGESATLRLEQPVHVLIAYGTALVRDGQVYFYDDLYGYDRQLDDALRQRSRTRLSLAQLKQDSK